LTFPWRRALGYLAAAVRAAGDAQRQSRPSTRPCANDQTAIAQDKKDLDALTRIEVQMHRSLRSF
jgi:hypothetical protein